MTRPVTTHDIAREAGVSRTTVSYVLNDRAGTSVSPKTRKRVLATARKLGYVANSAAEMLVTGRSENIGLVLSRPELVAVDGSIPIMISGLNEVCRKSGYRLLMESVHDPPGVNDYLDLAKSKRVDSMIVINPRKGDPALRKVIESKFPVLVWGSSEHPRESAIATQETKASTEAVRYLIALGHRRIAHISHASLEYVAVHRRLDGYRAALRAANISIDPALFAEGDFTVESGYRAMKHILTSKACPTALFAGNDTIAVGAMLAIREAGLSIPDDFSVVGYDDLPLAAYACPPLTTIRTHAFEQGKLLAEAAIGLMNKQEIGSRQDVIPLELIVRKSCGSGARRDTSLDAKKKRPSSQRPRRTATAISPAVEL